LRIQDEGSADLVSKLRETGVNGIEAALQGDHELNAGLLALCSELLTFAHTGGERLLLQHMYTVFGSCLDDFSANVMWNGDDHHVELFDPEHLMEVGVAVDAQLVSVFADGFGIFVTDGHQFCSVG